MTSALFPTAAWIPSRGETSCFTFNDEEPPPTVIILMAFSPTTRIFFADARSTGRTLEPSAAASFFRSTIPSAPIWRAAARCSGELMEPKGFLRFMAVRKMSFSTRPALSSRVSSEARPSRRRSRYGSASM